MHQRTPREDGAVSIFIVIFFALLLSVITLSFIGIVIRDATQSTNNDLSRSAYDSAQAGIEDAKRAIAQSVKQCLGGSASACNVTKTYFNDKDCTAFTKFARDNGIAIASGTNDVPVQGNDDGTFNQAYTCVTVTMNTPDYVGSKQPYQSDLIPLDAVTTTGAPASATGITLDWFTHTDAGLGDVNDATDFTPRPSCSASATGSSCDLTRESGWDTNSGAPYTPSLMRIEIIPYGTTTISDAALQTAAKTLFLYPAQSGASDVSFDANVTPPDSAVTPPIIPVKCGGHDQYACRVKIALGTAAGQRALLRVTPVYKKTTFRVGLTGSQDLLFNGVQPIVDSTGRANDLFRRVQARVRVQNQILYPEFAVDVKNELCKNYSVGAQASDFRNYCI